MPRRISAALFMLAVILLGTQRTALGAQLRDASVVAPAGASCVLHPKGDAAPEHSLAIDVDADGIARFQTSAATQSGVAAALALDCTGPKGKSQTIAIDLRSESTFASRPFDAVRAGLSVRPALTVDPESYSVGELIRQGYGLRPDPKANPAGYARWLAGVKVPYHFLRAVNSGYDTPGPTSRLPHPSATITSTGTFVPWTGAILTGSYQQNATAATTVSYLANEATFHVPPITPGLYGTGTAWMSIWNGLDKPNLLQAIVWVQTAGGQTVYSIHRQDFSQHPGGGAEGDGAGVLFTPKAGDAIFAEEWYCDATGNPNLAGGYACIHMQDNTRNLVWDCSQANNSSCASYKLTPQALTNGNLGQSAEFVIENDTGETIPNLNDWPPFASVTMLGSALVVQGSGAGATLNTNNGNWVTVQSDASVQLAPDWTKSKSYVGISLIGVNGVVWADGPAQCQAGTLAPGGNVSCSRCPAGTFSPAGASNCTECSPGTFAAGGAAVCSACSRGSFSSTAGAAACSLCTAGSFSSANGALTCPKCPAGSSSESGANICLVCGSMPADLATTDNLVCSAQNPPNVTCVSSSISFVDVGPAKCPPNSVAQSTSKGWSCSTPAIPSCAVTCSSTFKCVSVPPCTLQEAAAGKCTMPNPTCGNVGQKPCPPKQ
jgi:hypothetical protein